MNTDELLKCVSKYFTLKKCNKGYNAYIGDQIVGFFVILGKDAKSSYDALSLVKVMGNYCVSFRGNYIPLGANDVYTTLWAGLDKEELEQSVKELYTNCLLNRAASSYLRECN